jgi:hypothetical protein
VEIIDVSELLARLKELGPLGEPFEQAVRRGLEVAATLPPDSRRKLMAGIFETASNEIERQACTQATRASLRRLSTLLDEFSALFREASEQAEEVLRKIERAR